MKKHSWLALALVGLAFNLQADLPELSLDMDDGTEDSALTDEQLMADQFSTTRLAPGEGTASSPPAPYHATERTRDSVRWERPVFTTNRAGRITVRTNSYVQLETSKHYWKSSQWRESHAEIDIVENGAVARRTPHKIAFAPNINSPISVEFLTTQNKRLKFRPLGLAYYDFHANTNILIAELQDSIGQLVATNQIIYTNAFSGLMADVRYTLKKSGLEQDVILRQRPPLLPEDYGLNPVSTRLLILTEFVDPPADAQPVRQVRRGWQSDTVDKLINFGGTRIGQGTAFSIGAGADRNHGVPVHKQWVVLEGRQFLVEEVSFIRILPALRNLQASSTSGTRPFALPITPPIQESNNPLLSPSPINPSIHQSTNPVLATLPPAPGARAPAQSAILVAGASSPQAGLVLDFPIETTWDDVTLRGDTTYEVTGYVTLGGTTTIEGGTVVKYNRDALLSLYSVVCKTGPYRPAIFTAIDDQTVGVSMSKVEPSGYYAGCALYLPWGGHLSYVNIRHANEAVYCGILDSTFNHCQFLDCNVGIIAGAIHFDAGNILMSRVGINFYLYSSTARVEHLTSDQAGSLVEDPDFRYFGWCNGTPSSSLTLVNSLTASITNGYARDPVIHAVYTDHTYDFPTAEGVFQTVGAGSCYLVNDSTNRNAGTMEIQPALAAALQTKTTCPPSIEYCDTTILADTTFGPLAQRDTGLPDLGWHYDPLDFITCNCATTNATLTLVGGVAVAYYDDIGIWLQDGATIVSEGSPTNMNHFTDYRTVQEQPTKLGSFSESSSGAPVSAYRLNPSNPGSPGRFRFTAFSRMAPVSLRGATSADLSTDDLGDGQNKFTTLEVRDCSFLNGQSFFSAWSGLTASFTNNLFETYSLAFEGYPEVALRNNLFWKSSVCFSSYDPAWAVSDNAFDSGGLTDDPEYPIAHDHNAFINESLAGVTPDGTDKVLASFTYADGPLGCFYQQSSDLQDADRTRTADLFGLYHYTTRPGQTKEAASLLDVGFHYVAIDPSTGLPWDGDSDGLADYLEDANGNGQVDPGETDFNNRDTDGDGLWDGEELLIPIDASNPALGHLDPFDPDTGDTGVPDGEKDSDHDGISNLGELRQYGSDPANAHTFNAAKTDPEYLFTAIDNETTTRAGLTHSPLPDGRLQVYIYQALPGATYDLYFAPSTTAERWQYRRIFCGIVCDDYGAASFVIQPPQQPNLGSLVILSAEDDDDDGLSNGYEAWFNYGGHHTIMDRVSSVHNPGYDSDGDGMSDGWEVQYGLDPTVSSGDDGANGNTDGDYDPNDPPSPLTNKKEYDRYWTFDGSYDPLKEYGTSANRPVVSISAENTDPSCETASFKISRYAGNHPDYSSSLKVYYSLGGTLSHASGDYTLDPGSDWATRRIYSAVIPADAQTVTIPITFVGHPVTSGAKTLKVALTPYGVASDPQFHNPGDWDYVVDLQGHHDQIAINFSIDKLRPSANDQPVQTCKGTSLQITLGGSDPCSHSLTFAKVTDPAHGDLSVVTGDSVTYTPKTGPDFCGQDSFTFKVNNGIADSAPATVTIQVGDPDPIPNCQDVMTGKGMPVTITLSGYDTCAQAAVPKDSLNFGRVIGSDPSLGRLGAITSTDPTHASVLYTPYDGQEGSDEFRFTVSNCRSTPSSSELVTITVVPAPTLTLECLPDAIALKWTLPQWLQDLAASGFIEAFAIYRCSTPSPGDCSPPATPYATVDNWYIVRHPELWTFLDRDLQPNTAYCYQVTFTHRDQCDISVAYLSPPSDKVCATTCCPGTEGPFWTDHRPTPEQLAQAIVGPNPNLTVSSVTYTGAPVARGTFGNGAAANLPFSTGVILSSGDIALARGPNDQDEAEGKDNQLPAGDTDLNTVISYTRKTTQDAAVLEFDLTAATATTLVLHYVFASEEYPNWQTRYDDVVAIFVDGVNIALLPSPSVPVSVFTVNRDVNSDYYLSNPLGSPNLQYNGRTIALTAQAEITVTTTPHRIKIAIADTLDRIYDSAVFIEAQVPPCQ